MIRIQAENALFSGPVVASNHPGSEGTFVDFKNPTGDFIEWTVEVAEAGDYNLSFRYANGLAADRPLALAVNGVSQVAGLSFPGTSSWSQWKAVTQLATLNAGANTIRLTATGKNGANFDWLEVSDLILPPPVDVEISDASATEGTDSHLVFDVTLSSASTKDVVLDLAAVDGTAKGGLIGNFGIDPSGNPIDYGNQAFEFSNDGGVFWQAAANGTKVTFTPGRTALKVRLTVNNDMAEESTETLSLRVANVLAGSVGNASDTGAASLIDNDNPKKVDVLIADASATEGIDSSLVFDVTLSSTSTQSVVLDLAAIDGTAKGGLISDFGIDPAGDPIDYGNQAFEFSNDGGVFWQAAVNGTEVTFAPGQTALKVRLAVNNDDAEESTETLSLGVVNVLSGSVGNASDTGTGSLIDDDSPEEETCPPISLLPCTDIRIEGNRVFNFDGTDSGLTDKDSESLGFTMVDPTSNPSNLNPQEGVVGYLPENLDVDDGKLKITTTSGIQARDINSLDNALGIGLNVPSRKVSLETTLVDLPTAPGGFAQAGLWFGKAEGGGAGSSEDNYIKLVVLSRSSGDYSLQALLEKNGVVVQSKDFDIPDNLASLNLNIDIDPFTQTATAKYDIGGGLKTLSTFKNIPQEWFSFDQAGINPSIATRSFGGILATDRNADSSQVFSFEDFSIVESLGSEPNPTGPTALFDRWSVPVNNPTSMAMGPDGRLYVATLFGTIHAFTLNSETRTFTDEVITTIPDQEGGNRLTLGLAIDPDSTASNVILWVSHSDGSVSNGALNSGKISRLSGPGFTQKEDVITGLPRAIANHATNSIDFGPDGKLYIWQGGNTGAGAANTAPTEFLDRPEQPLTAAALVADIPRWKSDPTNFNGNVASPIGEFIDEFYARKASELGRPFTEVQVYASGLRNTYDGVFHSSGNLYAPDNGLGVVGTVPPVPRLGDPTDRSITTLFGKVPTDNPGKQNDPLNRIVEGGYYGHPNPYRDEVIFKDGKFQGFNATNTPPGHPAYIPPFFDQGANKSANGITEYTANNFFGQLKGDLLITNFSQGDDIRRIELSPDGLAVKDGSSPLIAGFGNTSPVESLAGNFTDPLPITMGPNGSIFVGEFNGGKISILESIGTWRRDLPQVPAPSAILDAGSTTAGGKLYMVGGKTSAAHVSSFYVYDPGDPIDPTDDVWSTAPNLPGAAVENPAVVSLGGRIYAFGGSTAPFSGAVSNAAVFDPTTSGWTPLANMPTARGGATAQVVDGEIYVVGGLADNGTSLNTVEIFDPITGQWSAGPSLTTARDNAGSAVVDDLLYVFGGRTRNVNDTLNSLEIYNPATDLWTFGNSMPTSRRAIAVGTIGDKIQVTGGEGSGKTFAENEEYNITTGLWKPLTSISTPRHGTAFGTIDDVTYVIGGGPVAGGSFTNVVEAFTL